MKKLALCLLALGLVAGCGPTAQTLTAMQVACKVDAVAQPIVVTMVAGVATATAGPAGTTLAAAGTAVDAPLHAAIVAACAQIGGVPASTP